MSQENVELVRHLLEMFGRRDHEGVFEYYDPKIEWDATRLSGAAGTTLPDDAVGVYRGHAGVRAYWRTWLGAWKELQFEVEDVLDAGDEVVALIRNQRQWGRHSGLMTEMPPYALIFAIRRGKVTRWRAYADQDEALRAVGAAR